MKSQMTQEEEKRQEMEAAYIQLKDSLETNINDSDSRTRELEE
jgi:hypothetical protein